mgnify:CR=1 FL=1
MQYEVTAVSFSSGRHRTTWSRSCSLVSRARRRTTRLCVAVSPSSSPGPGEDTFGPLVAPSTFRGLLRVA